MDRRAFIKLGGAALATTALSRHGIPSHVYSHVSTFTPGWTGTMFAPSDTTANWSIERDTGSSASLSLADGLDGQTIALDWNLGTGDWVQGKHTFSTPINLSDADIFGVSLHGDDTAVSANTVSFMFADVNDVFYGYDMVGKYYGINQIGRWMNNLALPKKLLYYLFDFGGGTTIDWSQINRFFVVVKRHCEWVNGMYTCHGGGNGRLIIDQIQYDTAADWPRQTTFERAHGDAIYATKAIDYLLSQQDENTGLFLSWKEEEAENPPPRSYLYDQALVSLALTREGIWQSGVAQNESAVATEKLVSFLTSEQHLDGHWPRAWHTRTGAELADDGWVGDQAWWVIALAEYGTKSGNQTAVASAQSGAGWLAEQIDESGKLTGSTEGNVDAWWAFVATGRGEDAAKVQAYLLDPLNVWDADLQYWWRGENDPVVAMDAATWLSLFARHPLVGRPEMGRAALSFVHRTLITESEDGLRRGFDTMGPVSIWNEGIGQYVAAGGADAQSFLDMLIAQQQPDGSIPAATENWTTDVFAWLSTWHGLASTSWFYFALTGAPFPAHKIYLPLITGE